MKDWTFSFQLKKITSVNNSNNPDSELAHLKIKILVNSISIVILLE